MEFITNLISSINVKGFLTIKGWEGVTEIYFLTFIGVFLAFLLLYFGLVYHKNPKPKKRSIKMECVKLVCQLPEWL